MLSLDAKLAEIKRLYYQTTRRTIRQDLAKALDGVEILGVPVAPLVERVVVEARSRNDEILAERRAVLETILALLSGQIYARDDAIRFSPAAVKKSKNEENSP